ncbi:MAG: sodium-dependent transporter [Bacteroidales bacterium]|jgi:NSS family neurotransmitter:Na+ symporter|nr:sodium-dependent transporter [Bacteroidales bacterium]
MQQKITRDGFASKFGVLVAAAGSAVGLGNLWRFPYMVGENGGSAFLLIYLFFMIVLCLPVLIAEFVIGRRAQRDVIDAFNVLAPRSAWKGIGIAGLCAALVILGFYCVVGGWTLAYIGKSIFSLPTTLPGDYYAGTFTSLITSPVQPLVWCALFIALNAFVVSSGVKNGIERYSKILMPILFVMIVVLAIRAITLDSDMKGLRFLFQPDFSKVTGATFLAALGQAFFSLSIGMGAMITYGSYIPKDSHLVKTSIGVMSTDMLFSLLAGLAVIPAVFAFGISPAQGPGLVFVIFPEIFSKMPMGYVLEILFFTLLAIAALTSSISLFEVLVAWLVDAKKLSRRVAMACVTVVVGVLSILASLSLGMLPNISLFGKNLFNFFDSFSSNILLPLGGLFICLFVGWRMKPADVRDELTNSGNIRLPLFGCFRFILRYITPIAIAVIFASGMGWLQI